MKRVLFVAALSLLGAPLLAAAADGWVVADIGLQAGPAMDYPSVDELDAGTPVSIQGCLDDWSWCDVIAYDYDERGWVPATFLEEDYRSGPVFIAEYGRRIGIPIVSFSIGSYWGHHYRGRPFYSQRQNWESRHIEHHAPPRPDHVVATRPQPRGTHHEHRAQAATTTTNRQTQPAPTRREHQTQPVERTGGQQQSAPRQTRPSDAAPQMTPRQAPQPAPRQAPKSTPPREVPRSEPPPHEHPMAEHAQPKPHAQPQQSKQHEPKPKDELKKPDKHKDNNDNGGGGG